nr:MlaD family protein [Kofleriaceae bacterium]
MADLSDLPEPVVRRKRRHLPSAIWIVPALAILAGAVLAVRTYLSSGPTIKITFENADGLDADKADVRFKNVPVGKVTSVDLADDHRHVVATVELSRGASSLAVKDSQFWVERPRVGVGGVSGLETLLSGAYIGVDIGTSTDRADEFVGLEKPPSVTRDQRGSRFELTATDAGSLAVRSPVYLRRVSVGWVTAANLASDGKTVNLEVFVQAPYDKDVTDKTVFWNSSGLDVALDANGLRVDAQSLATVVAGGIAFDVRDPHAPGAAPRAGATYELYPDRARAMAPPEGIRVAAKLRFRDDIRGIGVGTPLDLGGIQLGVVDAVQPGYDDATHAFYFDVTASVFPERLGPAYTAVTALAPGKPVAEALQTLVARGLHAQIRSGNLVTGQAYVALAWFVAPPSAKAGAIATDHGAWVIPTEPGGSDVLQKQVQEIVAKIDHIPFDAIGANVQGMTASANALVGHLDRDVAPEAAKAFVQAQGAIAAMRQVIASIGDNVAAPDSAIQQSTRATLEELDRAAYSMRSLADYLEHHPESLLRGRASGDEPRGK